MNSRTIAAAVCAAFCSSGLLLAQPGLTDRERAMLERIDRLEKRIAALEARESGTSTPTVSAPPISQPAVATAAPSPQPPDAANTGILGLSGTTLNFYLDGYYGWNFNRPATRTNALRANDTLANNFTLNQLGLILERAPDVAAGRRYGGRVDLMFGQNTETLQGSALNEPRPNVYRHLFQAYGTYIFPVGSGLTLDFGKFASSLGLENNYAYDEFNYSRSFYFNYLPYYHMGFRTSYNLSDKVNLQYWLVNGANQTEDFNGFKSNALLWTLKPSKTLTWNVNYYTGLEQQQGKARTHIVDTYATWSPTAKFTAAGEFDYVTAHGDLVSGGAGYMQYHFTPHFTMAGRFEYLHDRGGLFSGATQNLKEHTVTATYQLVDGFQLRLEHRRDFSNRPYFTANAPLFRPSQNTATLALIWWFGGKRESW